MNNQNDENHPAPPAPQRLRRTLNHGDPRDVLLRGAWGIIDANQTYNALSRHNKRELDTLIYMHVLTSPTPDGLNRFINNELNRINNERPEHRGPG